MQAQNRLDDLDKWMVKEIKKAFERMYKKRLSEAVKRAIQAKKLQKKL